MMSGEGYAAQLREAARLFVDLGERHNRATLAEALGVSRSRASDLLRELRSVGAIEVDSGRRYARKR